MSERANVVADAGQISVAVVYNPIKIDEALLRRAVERSATDAGIAADAVAWLQTSSSDWGTGMAREAVRLGAQLVIAAGGDGTVRAVAEGIANTGVALGLIPAGTGNLLARNLNLDLGSMSNAVTLAFTGADRAIDLGIVEMERENGKRETTAFAVLGGVGIDADMIANTPSEAKRRIGWLAYVGGILRSRATSHHRRRIHYRIDGGARKTTRVHTIMVANCGILPGNVVLMPDAVIDDGMLDVALLRPRGFLGWLQIMWRLIRQSMLLHRTELGRKWLVQGRPLRALAYLTARTVDVRFEEPQEFEVDGDDCGPVVGLRFTIKPGALTVRVPARRRTTVVEAADEAIERVQQFLSEAPAAASKVASEQK